MRPESGDFAWDFLGKLFRSRPMLRDGCNLAWGFLETTFLAKFHAARKCKFRVGLPHIKVSNPMSCLGKVTIPFGTSSTKHSGRFPCQQKVALSLEMSEQPSFWPLVIRRSTLFNPEGCPPPARRGRPLVPWQWSTASTPWRAFGAVAVVNPLD